MQREEEPEGATEEEIVEKSLKRKEAAIRYRLQMAPFTWAVAGETVGAGIVEWLRGIAATADVMLSHEGGHSERVVHEVCAPHT